jgi:hypothetical protein
VASEVPTTYEPGSCPNFGLLGALWHEGMTVLGKTTPARARTTGTIDLRGEGGPAPTAVLADPTGRRAALLRTAGRVVGLLFVLWFCGLVLAGLGLLPVSDLPLGHSLAPAAQPKKLTALPRPRQPSRRDLRPARALPTTSAAVPAIQRRAPSTPVTRRPVTTQHSSTSVTTTQPGRRLGNSGTPSAAPASPTTTTTPGKSGSAPAYGKQPTTTTTTSTTPSSAPGRSGSAPGHDPTKTTGNGASVH